MPYLLLWIGIGSITFHLITGLTLTSNSSIIRTTGFTLICDVQGAITTALTITDPSAIPAVQCFAPPGACGSAVSNTFHQDTAAGTLTVNIIQANVHTTNSKGSWSCSDGTSSASYQVTEIVSFREPVVWASSADDGATVTVKFECIFPYPDEIKIEYVKASDRSSVMKTETGVTFTNGTASNCPVADARAISTEGTFTLSHSGLAESAYVRVTASLFGESPSGGYSNFTVIIVSPPTPDKCPLFQYAFWPCFCIVLVGTLLVIGVSYHVGKESKLQEGSLKKSCGCCPSDNKFCMAVCPLCTDALCTGSKKTAKNVISVVVFLCVAAVIGVVIAFGLGVDSGKCILALILSIVCGLALMAIFTVSVYPHWPCLPEKGNGGLYNLCGR